IGAAEAKDKKLWDGEWSGAWGGRVTAKIVVKDGRVVEYDYNGRTLSLGSTHASGDTLTFAGTRPDFVITMKRMTDNSADARYHGPDGEGEAILSRQ
ncbi:MAG TPA: hypothetical protein VKV96_17110, partial [Roseiarcus sp.]|nr:hypothetical protein [Roseiarcus sp.]